MCYPTREWGSSGSANEGEERREGDEGGREEIREGFRNDDDGGEGFSPKVLAILAYGLTARAQLPRESSSRHSRSDN